MIKEVFEMAFYVDAQPQKCPLCGGDGELRDSGECVVHGGNIFHSGTITFHCDDCGEHRELSYNGEEYRQDIYAVLEQTRIEVHVGALITAPRNGSIVQDAGRMVAIEGVLLGEHRTDGDFVSTVEHLYKTASGLVAHVTESYDDGITVETMWQVEDEDLQPGGTCYDLGLACGVVQKPTMKWGIYEVDILSVISTDDIVIGEAGSPAGWVARVSLDELSLSDEERENIIDSLQRRMEMDATELVIRVKAKDREDCLVGFPFADGQFADGYDDPCEDEVWLVVNLGNAEYPTDAQEQFLNTSHTVIEYGIR